MTRIDLQMFGGRGGSSGGNGGANGSNSTGATAKQNQANASGANLSKGSTSMGDSWDGGTKLQRAIGAAERRTSGSDGLNHTATQNVLRENVREGDSVVVQRTGGEIHYKRTGNNTWNETIYQRKGNKLFKSSETSGTTKSVARSIAPYTIGRDPEGDYSFRIDRKRR
jgi:hypothetical protein